MQQHHARIRARGAEVVAIGQGTAGEAEHFCRQAGATYPCLGDPERTTYRAFGLARGGWWEILVEPLRRGAATGRWGWRLDLRGAFLPHSDWFQLPGVALVDSTGIVRYLHRARHAGDLPLISSLLRVLDRATAGDGDWPRSA